MDCASRPVTDAGVERQAPNVTMKVRVTARSQALLRNEQCSIWTLRQRCVIHIAVYLFVCVGLYVCHSRVSVDRHIYYVFLLDLSISHWNACAIRRKGIITACLSKFGVPVMKCWR